ncbi:MAG: hypothetical protein QMC23_05890 [Rubritalea sp.]|jgi:hypothetical protein
MGDQDRKRYHNNEQEERREIRRKPDKYPVERLLTPAVATNNPTFSLAK